MSGLEVVALVVGIVSAFSGTASFLRELKKKKKDESSHKSVRIQRLQKAVELAPPEIQQEYDHDFSIIGRRFAVGDDICRTELTSVMIKMQQDMIEKLQNLLLSTSSPVKTIDYDAIFNTSTQAKLNSISALAQQYQRFSTAAPIVRLPQSLPIAHNNRPEYCAGALALQSGTSRISIDWKCDPCGFSMLPWGPRPPKGKTKPLYPPTWAVGCAGMTWVFSYAQHLPIDTTDRTPGRVMVYRQCIICWAVEGVVSKKLGREEWLAHMNEHFMSGGYEMCRNKAGTQLRKRNCGVRTCKKIHSVG